MFDNIFTLSKFYKNQLIVQEKIQRTFNLICMIDNSYQNKYDEFLEEVKQLQTTTDMSIVQSCDYVYNNKLGRVNGYGM